MARPKNETETKTFEVTVPVRLHDYLCYLSRNTVLGASPNTVAAHILVQQVTLMVQDGFHEMDFPSDGD